MSIEKYNSIVEAGNTLVFPKGELKKPRDTVLVTGEVSWARTEASQLKDNEKKLYISVKISDENFQTLSELQLPDNRILSGLKEQELPVPEVDDEGEPLRGDDGKIIYKTGARGKVIKEFAYCQVTISQNKTVNGQEVIIPVINEDTGERISGYLNEGTKVTVLGQAYYTSYDGKNYLGLNLKEIRVHDIVQNEASDPWAVLGMTKAEAAAVPPPPPAQATNEAAVQEATPQPMQEAPGDTFEDEVPF